MSIAYPSRLVSKTKSPAWVAAEATPPRHIHALDGLRGLAVMAVLLFHFAAWSKYPSVILHMGWLGVHLFFALSGFLITGILADSAGKDGYFTNFYARRSLRIFPLYFGVLAAVFLVGPLLGATRSPEFRRLAEVQGWFWLYVSNFQALGPRGVIHVAGWIEIGQFWSLAVEEHFYLVWPAIVLVSGRRLASSCVAVIVLAFASRCAMVGFHWHTEQTYDFTWCRMDALAAGGLMATLARRGRSGSTLTVPRIAWPMFLAGAVVMTALAAKYGFYIITARLMQTVGHTAAGLGFAGLVAIVAGASSSGFIGRVCSHRWLSTLGKYSYGIYVYHPFLVPSMIRVFQPLMKPLGPTLSFLIIAAAGTAVSLAVSVVSYHLFEAPFLRLKRYFPTGRKFATDRGASLTLA